MDFTIHNNTCPCKCGHKYCSVITRSVSFLDVASLQQPCPMDLLPVGIRYITSRVRSPLIEDGTSEVLHLAHRHQIKDVTSSKFEAYLCIDLIGAYGSCANISCDVHTEQPKHWRRPLLNLRSIEHDQGHNQDIGKPF